MELSAVSIQLNDIIFNVLADRRWLIADRANPEGIISG
jgi:hypothetical protein